MERSIWSGDDLFPPELRHIRLKYQDDILVSRYVRAPTTFMPIPLLCKPVALSVHCVLSQLHILDPRIRDSPITDQRIHAMVARAETPQLHLLPVFNLLRVAIAPLHRHFRVRVRVDQDVERAVARIELRKEGHGGGDLAENGLDFKLDVLLRLLRGWFGRRVSVFEVRRRDGTSETERDACVGAAFSLSGGFAAVSLEAAFLEGLLNIWTSNCHRSTCSPVSLLDITTTSFEILPPVIHLLSWDMIFLMYALT